MFEKPGKSEEEMVKDHEDAYLQLKKIEGGENEASELTRLIQYYSLEDVRQYAKMSGNLLSPEGKIFLETGLKLKESGWIEKERARLKQKHVEEFGDDGTYGITEKPPDHFFPERIREKEEKYANRPKLVKLREQLELWERIKKDNEARGREGSESLDELLKMLADEIREEEEKNKK